MTKLISRELDEDVARGEVTRVRGLYHRGGFSWALVDAIDPDGDIPELRAYPDPQLGSRYGLVCLVTPTHDLEQLREQIRELP